MSLLDNPLIKNLIKSKLPEVLQNLDSVESGLVSYINAVELRPGETHAAMFTEIQGNQVFFCLGAFNKKLMVRLIEVKPAKTFVQEIITNALN